LAHPILEHKPPRLNRVEVWRIGRQIPEFTACGGYDILDELRVMETGSDGN
jgi:hypothetical protein